MHNLMSLLTSDCMLEIYLQGMGEIENLLLFRFVFDLQIASVKFLVGVAFNDPIVKSR